MILLIIIFLLYNQFALAISSTLNCNKIIDHNCDNSCISSQSIFNAITNYADKTSVFDPNYTLYDLAFNMIDAQAYLGPNNNDGCIVGSNNSVSFYYSTPAITQTPAVICDNNDNKPPSNPKCSGYTIYNNNGYVRFTNTPTQSTTTSVTISNIPYTTPVVNHNSPHIDFAGYNNITCDSYSSYSSYQTTEANDGSFTSSVINYYAYTCSGIAPPTPNIIQTGQNYTSTYNFTDGSSIVYNVDSNGNIISIANGTASSVTYTDPLSGNTASGTIQSSLIDTSHPSAGIVIKISSDPIVTNRADVTPDTQSTSNNNNDGSISTTTTKTYQDRSSTKNVTTVKTLQVAPIINTSQDLSRNLIRTVTYNDGSQNIYTFSNPLLHTLIPGQTSQFTTIINNDTILRAVNTADYICVEVDTNEGWFPLGCIPQASQAIDNSARNCFSLPQSGFPMTATVVACINDTILLSLMQGSNNAGEVSALSNFQVNMQDAVMGALVIYIIIFGIRLVFAQEIPNKGELFMFIVKMILVIYFSVGFPVGSSSSLNGDLTQSTNGVKDIIIPGFQALSLTLTQLITNAQNDNVAGSNTNSEKQLAAQAREKNAIKASTDRACNIATDAYNQSNASLANADLQLATISLLGAGILYNCYALGGIISPFAPLCIIASAAEVSAVIGASNLQQNYQTINNQNLNEKNTNCAAANIADRDADAANNALSNNVSSTNSSLCYFDPTSYNANYQYLSIWDNLDCHVAYYLGFLSSSGIGRDVILVLAVFFTGFFSLIFSGQLVFAVFSIIIAILLLSIMVFFVNTYLLSLIGMAILSFLSPLFVPLCLFKVTKGYFDIWLKLLFSFALQPVVITAFISLMCKVLDRIIYGTCKWSTTSSGFWTISNTSANDTNCTGSLGAMMNFSQISSPTQATIDFFVTSMPFYIFDPSIMIPLFTATLFCFLFYFMAQNITEFASELVGGPDLNEFTGIKSNSLFNSSMSRIKKMLPQMSNAKKTAKGNIKLDLNNEFADKNIRKGV